MPPSVCIIGAGCSGITAIKNMLQAGIQDVVCFEKSDRIGGNWVYTAQESHSSVCETTHIISSKKLSEYIDFPMPEDYPDYPSHRQVLAYFESYVQHFGLEPYIRFNTEVVRAVKIEEERWELTLSDDTKHQFDYLLTANGHHAMARHPELPGAFEGTYMHSHGFKNNKGFEGKRVLVIGAGNSGCDCAVEISRVARKVSISMRRPYYIVPKFIMGKPVDTYNKAMLMLPDVVRKILLKMSLRLQIGRYSDYGLQNPDYSVTSCHPVLNSELLYRIRHGKVHPRKGIQKVEGSKVTFDGGYSEEYDVIVAATGYKIVFPFFDPSFVDFENAERISLYLRMIHPEHPSLFFIGLVQPQGCIWPIADYQSKLVANYIMGRCQLPSDVSSLAEKEASQIARDFIASKRHSLEVHFHPFVRKIQKHIPASAPEWPSELAVT